MARGKNAVATNNEAERALEAATAPLTESPPELHALPGGAAQGPSFMPEPPPVTPPSAADLQMQKDVRREANRTAHAIQQQAHGQAATMPTPSLRSLGQLQKTLPGTERIRIRKRLADGTLMYINEYNWKALQPVGDIEAFIAKYIRPHFGGGEYVISGVTASNAEIPAGSVPIADDPNAPASPASTQAGSPQVEFTRELLADQRAILTQHAPQAPQNPVTLLRDLKQLEREFTPAVVAAPPVVTQGDSLVSGVMSLVGMMMQQQQQAQAEYARIERDRQEREREERKERERQDRERYDRERQEREQRERERQEREQRDREREREQREAERREADRRFELLTQQITQASKPDPMTQRFMEKMIDQTLSPPPPPPPLAPSEPSAKPLDTIKETLELVKLMRPDDGGESKLMGLLLQERMGPAQLLELIKASNEGGGLRGATETLTAVLGMMQAVQQQMSPASGGIIETIMQSVPDTIRSIGDAVRARQQQGPQRVIVHQRPPQPLPQPSYAPPAQQQPQQRPSVPPQAPNVQPMQPVQQPQPVSPVPTPMRPPAPSTPPPQPVDAPAAADPVQEAQERVQARLGHIPALPAGSADKINEITRMTATGEDDKVINALMEFVFFLAKEPTWAPIMLRLLMVLKSGNHQMSLQFVQALLQGFVQSQLMLEDVAKTVWITVQRHIDVIVQHAMNGPSNAEPEGPQGPPDVPEDLLPDLGPDESDSELDELIIAGMEGEAQADDGAEGE